MDKLSILLNGKDTHTRKTHRNQKRILVTLEFSDASRSETPLKTHGGRILYY